MGRRVPHSFHWERCHAIEAGCSAGLTRRGQGAVTPETAAFAQERNPELSCGGRSRPPLYLEAKVTEVVAAAGARDTRRRMSAENVEVVRAAFQSMTSGHAASVFELYDPEVELDPSRAELGGLIGTGTYRGHEGVRRFFRDYYDAWQRVDYDIEQLVDAGERVVSAVKTRARGRTSGAEVELRIYGVWTIRNGRIVRVMFFATNEEALEVAGLLE